MGGVLTELENFGDQGQCLRGSAQGETRQIGRTSIQAEGVVSTEGEGSGRHC